MYYNSESSLHSVCVFSLHFLKDQAIISLNRINLLGSVLQMGTIPVSYEFSS
jgi:hypothetical protein